MGANGIERGDLIKPATFFLFLTVVLGLILRWQMAGYSSAHTSGLYLRRAHSHIGFYGALFPITWLFLLNTAAWIPGRRLMLFYGLMVALSIAGFLYSSYAPLSISSSTIILAIWLQFAWKNHVRRRVDGAPKCLALIAPSIALASLQIFAVAFLARTNPELSLLMTRSFLAVLIFGVFVPVSINSIYCSNFFILPWFVATIVSAVYLSGISDFWPLAFGPMWLALDIFRMITFRATPLGGEGHLRLVWGVFAGALGLTGLQILPHSYHYGIAGVHFLILGPIFLTFAHKYFWLAEKAATRTVYELTLAAMVVAILGNRQTLAATTGTVLIFLICAMAVGASFRNRRETNEQQHPTHQV